MSEEVKILKRRKRKEKGNFERDGGSFKMEHE